MLNIYSFFHLNLMYSSIEEDERLEVIKKSYWPLFELIDAGFPIGIESTGLTLEIINEIDSDWIKKLSKYIKNNQVEFIGSGYSQIIGPLVPSLVNKWNQKLGLEVYEKILGTKPKIALINEMAYSSGLIKHYNNMDYKSIIMEWNNPRSANPKWENEWRFFPQTAIDINGESIPVIWSDSIAFQKFQRYVHGEISLKKYTKYIKSNLTEYSRSFPLYTNDVEIFDYRPGRYHTETILDKESEWNRIYDLYYNIKENNDLNLVFPAEVLKNIDAKNSYNDIMLESLSHPIPVKKQEKYNINRWALTGRDDLLINTKCYKIYYSFIEKQIYNPNDWKRLCYLWSSDFRTHITDKRWEDYNRHLDSCLNKFFNNNKKSNLKNNKKSKINIINKENHLTLENNKTKVIFNKNKGLAINEIIFKNFSKNSLLGTLDHGYYDDISLGADYFSGHTVIERLGEHKITDLEKINPEIIKTEYDVTLKANHGNNNYKFDKAIILNNDGISFQKKIIINKYEKSIIRPYSFTFNPEAWDQDSLFIETNNGGDIFERFYLKGKTISHSNIYSSLISARHGFGNTEGVFKIGDKNKIIKFNCEMFLAALVPSIIYKEIDSTYFLRLQFSSCEIDETVKNKSSRTINGIISLSF